MVSLIVYAKADKEQLWNWWILLYDNLPHYFTPYDYNWTYRCAFIYKYISNSNSQCIRYSPKHICFDIIM